MKTLYQYLEGCKGQTKYLLTEDEYQEYQNLKDFKAKADKEIAEWDKGYKLHYCGSTAVLCKDKHLTKDPETTEDRCTHSVVRQSYDNKPQCALCGDILIEKTDKETQEDILETRRWEDHLRFHETSDDVLQDELGEIRTGIEDLLDAQGMYNRNLIRRVTELENDMGRCIERSDRTRVRAGNVQEKPNPGAKKPTKDSVEKPKRNK